MADQSLRPDGAGDHILVTPSEAAEVRIPYTAAVALIAGQPVIGDGTNAIAKYDTSPTGCLGGLEPPIGILEDPLAGGGNEIGIVKTDGGVVELTATEFAALTGFAAASAVPGTVYWHNNASRAPAQPLTAFTSLQAESAVEYTGFYCARSKCLRFARYDAAADIAYCEAVNDDQPELYWVAPSTSASISIANDGAAIVATNTLTLGGLTMTFSAAASTATGGGTENIDITAPTASQLSADIVAAINANVADGSIADDVVAVVSALNVAGQTAAVSLYSLSGATTALATTAAGDVTLSGAALA